MQRLLFLLGCLALGTSLMGQISVANSSNYDVKYYRCTWSIDPMQASISGSITTYFKPITNLNFIEFDAAKELVIDSVIHYRSRTTFTRPSVSVLRIKFTETIGALDSIQVYYHGTPDPSLNSYNQGIHGSNSPIIWTMSEPYGAKDWWPCKQSLNDKADSLDIFIIIPKGNKAASNGILKEIIKSEDKLVYHWKEKYPIATYLICAAVTNYSQYTILADLQNGPVPVQYYTYPEDSISSQGTISQILSIFHFYDSLFGPYPFEKEKYGHAQTSGSGGMENQTMTFINVFDLRLMAHELAHSWFGDKVTCASWRDIWLNEGFAKYCEYLSLGYAANPTSSKAWLQDVTTSITSQPNGSVYVTDTTTYGRIFDYRLSYWKGAYLLHMLRWKLGDEQFYNGIRNYINDPELAYSFARTSNLQRHLENVSGQSLTNFFDQWFYGQGYPSYHIIWNQVYSGQTNQIEISIHQTTSDPSISFFDMPIPILFKGLEKDTMLLFEPTRSFQTFHVNLGFSVNQVYFDPDLHVLSGDNNVTSLDEDFAIYPNPVADFLYIWIGSLTNDCEIEIYDQLGRKLIDFSTKENIFVVPISTLSFGTYFLRLTYNNKSISRKIVKL